MFEWAAKWYALRARAVLCWAGLCCAVQYLLSADTLYTYNVVLYVLQSTTLWCVLHTAMCWGYVERSGELQLAGLHL